MQDQSHLIKSAPYRRLARECLEIARTIQSDESRFALVEMAKSWFRLAEEARETHFGQLRLSALIGAKWLILRLSVFQVFRRSRNSGLSLQSLACRRGVRVVALRQALKRHS